MGIQATMTEQRGLFALLEAARFLEVGEANSSTEEAPSNNQCKPSKPREPRKGAKRSRAVSKEEMRQGHNESEKLRRRDMRMEFDDLKKTIPILKSGKHSSIAVLSSAVEYIEQLKDSEKKLEEKQKKLKAERESLLTQLQLLKEKNQSISDKEDAGEEKTDGRKRQESESTTISADSPKMFIDNGEIEPLEIKNGQNEHGRNGKSYLTMIQVL